MKRLNCRRLVFSLLTIIWMCVIFSFSARPADESTDQSVWVGMKICSIFVPGFESMPYEEQIAMAEGIDHPVRKCAHASEYCLLGFLFFYSILPVRTDGPKEKTAGENNEKKGDLKRKKWGIMPRIGYNICLRKAVLPAWLAGSLYAVSDEIHQLFVEGRACLFTDMLIDSGGVLAGCLFGGILLTLFWRNPED